MALYNGHALHILFYVYRFCKLNCTIRIGFRIITKADKFYIYKVTSTTCYCCFLLISEKRNHYVNVNKRVESQKRLECFWGLFLT